MEDESLMFCPKVGDADFDLEKFNEEVLGQFKRNADEFIERELGGEQRTGNAQALKSEYVGKSLVAVAEMAKIPALTAGFLACELGEVTAEFVAKYNIFLGSLAILGGLIEVGEGLPLGQVEELAGLVVGLEVVSVTAIKGFCVAQEWLDNKITEFQNSSKGKM